MNPILERFKEFNGTTENEIAAAILVLAESIDQYCPSYLSERELERAMRRALFGETVKEDGGLFDVASLLGRYLSER